MKSVIILKLVISKSLQTSKDVKIINANKSNKKFKLTNLKPDLAKERAVANVCKEVVLR